MDFNGNGFWAAAVVGATSVKDAMAHQFAGPVVTGAIVGAIVVWGPALIGDRQNIASTLATIQSGQTAIMVRLDRLEKQMAENQPQALNISGQQIQIAEINRQQARIVEVLDRVVRIQTEVITTLKLNPRPVR